MDHPRPDKFRAAPDRVVIRQRAQGWHAGDTGFDSGVNDSAKATEMAGGCDVLPGFYGDDDE